MCLWGSLRTCTGTGEERVRTPWVADAWLVAPVGGPQHASSFLLGEFGPLSLGAAGGVGRTCVPHPGRWYELRRITLECSRPAGGRA